MVVGLVALVALRKVLRSQWAFGQELPGKSWCFSGWASAVREGAWQRLDGPPSIFRLAEDIQKHGSKNLLLRVALSASARKGGALANFQGPWKCFSTWTWPTLASTRKGGALVNFEAVFSDILVFYGNISDLEIGCRDCLFTYLLDLFKFPWILDVGFSIVFEFLVGFDVESVFGADVESVGLRLFDNSVANEIVPHSDFSLTARSVSALSSF